MSSKSDGTDILGVSLLATSVVSVLTTPFSHADEAKRSELFVAVGHRGSRLTSENGIAWKNLQLGKEGEVYRGVAFGNKRWVAVGTYGGSNIFAATSDGVTWKTSMRDGRYSDYVRGIGFGKGVFLAIGGDPGSVGSSRPFVMQTTDGDQWSDVFPITGKNILRRIAFGNETFVGVGDRGRLAVSKDGRVWQDAPDVKAINTLVDIAFGKGVFVGVGLHGLRMVSSDGLKWSPRQLGEEGEHLNAIVWASDRFVAIAEGATYFSTDGRAWEKKKNHNAPTTLTYGQGIFVGARWKGRILRSTDALDWQEAHKCEDHVEAIVYGAV